MQWLKIKLKCNRIRLFDSHSHALYGSFLCTNGTAALMTFENEIAVAKCLKKNFKSVKTI